METTARPKTRAKWIGVTLLGAVPSLACGSFIYYQLVVLGPAPRIPIYPGAQHLERKTEKVELFGKVEVEVTSFETQDKLNDVQAFYNHALPENGWDHLSCGGKSLYLYSSTGNWNWMSITISSSERNTTLVNFWKFQAKISDCDSGFGGFVYKKSDLVGA